MFTAASILVRIVANPVSNVFQKLAVGRGASALFVIAATHALLAIAVVPLLMNAAPPSDSGFWGNMALCALLAAASNALLVQAMKLADLSVLGPINAYKAVVSLLPAVVLLGEVPNLQTVAGIGLIVAGSYFLTDPKLATPHGATPSRRPWLSLGVRYRLAALVLSATEAVFLKRALAYASPTTAFAWWAVLGLAAAALLGLLPQCRIDGRRELKRCRNSPRLYLALALTTGLMQYCTLVAFATVQVAAALALFQTSAVVSVLLGHHIFREPHLARRLMGTIIMVAGAVLIVLARRTDG
ncbi:MAG: DMT family transporter [Planctomycetes bacterium]|nr:DMT family transporter [Planctomycetota bacterium]